MRLFIPAGRLRPPAAGFSQLSYRQFLPRLKLRKGLLLPISSMTPAARQTQAFPMGWKSNQCTRSQVRRKPLLHPSREGGRRSFASGATGSAAASDHWLDAMFHLLTIDVSSSGINPVLVLFRFRQVHPFFPGRPEGHVRFIPPVFTEKPLLRATSARFEAARLAWANIAVPLWTRMLYFA